MTRNKFSKKTYSIGHTLHFLTVLAYYQKRSKVKNKTGIQFNKFQTHDPKWLFILEGSYLILKL